jgi:hypothetical protein
MANKVDEKLQKLSAQRTDIVKKIRALEGQLRKSGLSDSQVKSINDQITTLNGQRVSVENDYNGTKSAAGNAKDYESLKYKVASLTLAIERAKARGENFSDFNSDLNTAKNKLKKISPEVEKYFPELKTSTKITSVTTPSSGPEAAGLGKTPTSATSTLAPAPAPKPKPTPAPAASTVFTQPMTIAGQVDTTAGDSGLSTDKKVAGLEAAAKLELAGTLFEHVDSLKSILDKYLDPKNGWTDARFLQEIRNDPWYKKNSQEIKARYTQLYNYQDLVASGQAQGTTDYEKQIRTLKDEVLKKAREMGSGLASDPAAIQRVAENMYITNTGIEDALTTNLIAAAIRPIGGTIGGKPTEGYSGTALANYQLIQDAARKNGFTVADIIPGGSNEQQVLQGIATGAIDVNRIAQDARRLAAQGQPQYVRDLLGQGYNLEQIYSPYRQTMANILEIGDPNQISLNDPTLRMAITDKGDMNLYDFKKALRQDNRWQYTDTAKQEVSTAALSVLRDFGFQG